MLSIEEAEGRLLQATPRLGAERWPVDRALGRIAAHDLWAPTSIPPRPVAARRGFAIRHRDAPGRLEVWGSLDPGEAFEGSLGRRRAVRIEAGVALPDDATAVVTDPDLPTDGEHVTIGRRVGRGEGIIPRGAELPDERPVIPVGTRLGAPQLLLLESLGVETVEVLKRPRVALAPRRAGPLLSWLGRDAARLGLETERAPGGFDDPRTLAEATTTWDAIVRVGAPGIRSEPLVRHVAMYPGGELRLDRRDPTWIVELEGSALGAWAGWRWALTTLLSAWTGATPDDAKIPARLAVELARDPRRYRVWAVRRTRAEPTDLVVPVDGESAWSLRNTWGTITLKPGPAPCPAGELVRVQTWA